MMSVLLTDDGATEWWLCYWMMMVLLN